MWSPSPAFMMGSHTSFSWMGSTDGTEIYLANMARSIRTAVAFAEDELANLG